MNQILVRHGKGGKDRVTVLPDNVLDSLQMHLKKVRAIHNRISKKDKAQKAFDKISSKFRASNKEGDGQRLDTFFIL